MLHKKWKYKWIKMNIKIILFHINSEEIFDWIKIIICLKHVLWCKEMFCLR